MQDPIERFSQWLLRATSADRAIIPEPTAFALATVASDGRPSVRMLLLKGVGNSGFSFYTNLESRKAAELQQTEVAAMCFHWAALELQVRVEGPVSPVSDAEADAYFSSRSRESQIGAWASMQSRPIATPGDLDQRYAEFKERYRGAVVPRPPHWSGFCLVPERIEFWEGRPARLHHRELYTRSSRGWEVEVLYP